MIEDEENIVDMLENFVFQTKQFKEAKLISDTKNKIQKDKNVELYSKRLYSYEPMEKSIFDA